MDSLPSSVILKKNPRARRYALRLSHKDRCIHLVMPQKGSEKKALLFANDHIDWIENKLKTLPQTIQIGTAHTLPLFGSDYEINVLFDPNKKRTIIDTRENQIFIQTNQTDPSMRLKRYLKNWAKQRFENIAMDKATMIGKTISRLSIRDTSSRWGSCTSDAHISLSWRLIFAPKYAYDYVIAHEVAHLTHMDHSPQFWNLCESLCIDYKQGKKWMKDNSADLMRYN